MLEPETD